MSHPVSPPHLITLILLTAFSTLSLNMFLPSLANIAGDFEVDYAIVSLAIGGYLAVTAAIQLIVGPLSDRIGRRPVLLSALVIFTIASIGCVVADDIVMFLTCRMLQGGIISGYVLSMAIVRDTRSEQDAAGLIGYISMAMAVAPMLGPMLGGLLDTVFGWRSNFLFYAVSGCILLLLCWFDLGETKPSKKNHDANETQSAKPTELLGEPMFWAASLCSTFATGAFYIFLTGAPLVAKSTFAVNTAGLGLYIGSITFGFMVGSFVSGRLAGRTQPTTLMMAGRMIACLGLLGGALLVTTGFITPPLFFGSTIFVGLGNGITMPSCSAAVMSVRPELSGSAAGFNGAMIVAGGALMTTVTGLLLSENNPAMGLLLLMLAASFASLISVFWAMRLRKVGTPL